MNILKAQLKAKDNLELSQPSKEALHSRRTGYRFG